MKGLISEEEIKIASENYSVNRRSETGQVDFKAGVIFAEEKLKNLAIEFAEWHLSMFIISKSLWKDKKTSELFDIFLKQRDTLL